MSAGEGMIAPPKCRPSALSRSSVSAVPTPVTQQRHAGKQRVRADETREAIDPEPPGLDIPHRDAARRAGAPCTNRAGDTRRAAPPR